MRLRRTAAPVPRRCPYAHGVPGWGAAPGPTCRPDNYYGVISGDRPGRKPRRGLRSGLSWPSWGAARRPSDASARRCAGLHAANACHIYYAVIADAPGRRPRHRHAHRLTLCRHFRRPNAPRPVEATRLSTTAARPGEQQVLHTAYGGVSRTPATGCPLAGGPPSAGSCCPWSRREPSNIGSAGTVPNPDADAPGPISDAFAELIRTAWLIYAEGATTIGFTPNGGGSG